MCVRGAQAAGTLTPWPVLSSLKEAEEKSFPERPSENAVIMLVSLQSTAFFRLGFFIHFRRS